MKQLVKITYIIFVILASCRTSNNNCTYKANYLKKNIDTTREYTVNGVYCISTIKDTFLNSQNESIVRFNVFDRLYGKNIEDGVIYFYGKDTSSIIFNLSNHENIIKSGNYMIEAWASRYVGTKTKKLVIKKNKIIEINFFLGTKLEY